MTIIECDRCHLSDRDIPDELNKFCHFTCSSPTQDEDWDLCPHCYTEFVYRFMSMNSTKETVSHE